MFYLCIPTGYALGYIFGGLVAVPLGWRAPFLLEAFAMIPFILYCSFAPPIDIRGTKEKAGSLNASLNKVSKKLASRRQPFPIHLSFLSVVLKVIWIARAHWLQPGPNGIEMNTSLSVHSRQKTQKQAKSNSKSRIARHSSLALLQLMTRPCCRCDCCGGFVIR